MDAGIHNINRMEAPVKIGGRSDSFVNEIINISVICKSNINNFARTKNA